jgi:hypothetical protein
MWLRRRDSISRNSVRGKPHVPRTRSPETVNETASPPAVIFHRIYADAIPPMRADKSALGTMPASAFQYCEAMRAASSFGWYIFPPMALNLRWTGSETLIKNADDEWDSLTSVFLDDEFEAEWEAKAPEDMKDWRIPVATQIPIPGIVQIWTGLLVSTIGNWSLLARPIANVVPPRTHSCFEGLIETDRFKPCPLFINIRLQTTERDIVIARETPLFQVQPIPRMAHAEANMRFVEYVGLDRSEGPGYGLSDQDWDGLRRTTRSLGSRDPGTYGAATRRRGKQEVTE